MAPRSLKSKIKSPDSLKKLFSTSAFNRKNIVFTNGVFDLLHKGHVSYLERARKLGDVLVIAINSDDSVRRLKGPERPVNPLTDRLEVVAALECVDYVTWFSEDTPLKVILKLRPQILSKGGDYEPSKIVGASEVKSWGGKVKVLPFVQGRSTTAMIARAKK